jgi:hypothetical protein
LCSLWPSCETSSPSLVSMAFMTRPWRFSVLSVVSVVSVVSCSIPFCLLKCPSRLLTSSSSAPFVLFVGKIIRLRSAMVRRTGAPRAFLWKGRHHAPCEAERSDHARNHPTADRTHPAAREIPTGPPRRPRPNLVQASHPPQCALRRTNPNSSQTTSVNSGSSLCLAQNEAKFKPIHVRLPQFRRPRLSSGDSSLRSA